MKLKFIYVIFIFLLIGCSPDEPKPDPKPTPEPEPELPVEVEKVIYTGNLIISSDDDVANVKAAGYTHIVEGGLSIAGYSGNVITSLEGLESLIEIDHLIIHSTSIPNLKGLENLKKIKNGMNVIRASSLETMDELSNLEYLGGEIFFGENPDLNNFDGLKNAEIRDMYAVTITDNQMLVSIKGLEGLVSTESDINIGNNPNLANLQGLHNLEEVGWQLSLNRLYSLKNLEGLSSLKVVKNIGMYGNSRITTLDGIESLHTIRERLRITNNTALIDFCAISDLTDQAPSEWTISQNAYNPTKENLAAGNCKQ